MNIVSNKTIFHLLSSRQGDSFELGQEFFSLLSPDEKFKINRLLNDTSLHYFYRLNEGLIERKQKGSLSNQISPLPK